MNIKQFLFASGFHLFTLFFESRCFAYCQIQDIKHNVPLFTVI